MTKILMVCLGNICRSPLAEGILRHKLKERGITHVEVDSAGTSDYHVGEHPDRRSAANAATHGVDITKLVARQFVVSDFDRFDHIYVMDASNYNHVKMVSRHAAQMEKVDFILNTVWPGENRAVPDPYYGGEEGFENVFRLLDHAAEKIIAQITEA